MAVAVATTATIRISELRTKRKELRTKNYEKERIH